MNSKDRGTGHKLSNRPHSSSKVVCYWLL